MLFILSNHRSLSCQSVVGLLVMLWDKAIDHLVRKSLATARPETQELHKEIVCHSVSDGLE